MEQQTSAGRTCPKCDSEDYQFRHRKQVEADAEKGEPAAVETKYRCRACGHEWRVRVVTPTRELPFPPL